MAPVEGAAFSFPAGLVSLSDGVVLLGIGDPAGRLDPARIAASGPEGPVRPPFSWHRVPTRNGDVLLLIASAQPSLAIGNALRLAHEDGPFGEGAADLSTAPVVAREGVAALLGTTEPAALLAALRFVTAKALGTLRRAEDAELAANCLRLAAALLDAGSAAAQPVARTGAGLVLWSLPDAPPGCGGGAHTVLGPARLRRVPASGRAVLLPARQAGAVLLPADGGGPVRLPPPPSLSALPSLTELGRRTDPAGRALHRDAVAALAAGDAPARRLLRDLSLVRGGEPARACVAPEHPFGGALDMAVPDGEGGVFLRGWLRDPLGLVAGLTLRGPGGDRPLPLSDLHRFARPDLTETYAEAPHGGAGTKPGFAAHLSEAGALPGGQWSLRLTLTTGDTAHLVAPEAPAQPRAARDAVLGAVAPRHLTPALMRNCVAPAVERLHRAAMAGRESPEVVRIGGEARRPSSSPAVSLVVPLYRNLRYLRHQYAAFARDPLLRGWAELVYVLDSPDQREDLEHMLRGFHGVCGMPLTLVVQAANYGFASACNAGADASEAPVLALVNSDVVPAARGWLAPLLRGLDELSPDGRRPAAVGPKLLFEDGSLQHAGLFFEEGPGGEWYNSHYWKGFPRFHPPAQVGRAVPGVTGALVCLPRRAFEEVGGLCTDYVVGDYEDSDLCLRLREAGGEVAYVPAAELYHFERQSIRDHGAYARTAVCNYNRHVHHARWAPAIEALMARFPAPAGAGASLAAA